MDKTHKDFLQCRWEKAFANNCISRFLVALRAQFQSFCYFFLRFVVTFACFMFFRRPLLFTLSLSQPLKIIFILSHTPRPFHARLRAAPPPSPSPPTPLSEVRRASPKRNSRKKKMTLATARNFGIKRKKKRSPRPWSFLFVLTWLAVLTSSWSFAICSVKT